MRRKNPHPQRAVNARTVLKVSYLDARDKEEEEVEEEEEGEEKEEDPFGVASFEDDS